MAFTLHPRLEKGCFDFGKLDNCRVLLKNNSTFPWFIIVPEVDESITELHKLEAHDFAAVSFVIRQMSAFVDAYFHPDKINVASIGNQVSQLHIHVVARFESDPAWPGVVWASDAKKAYEPEQVARINAAYDGVFDQKD